MPQTEIFECPQSSMFDDLYWIHISLFIETLFNGLNIELQKLFILEW